MDTVKKSTNLLNNIISKLNIRLAELDSILSNESKEDYILINNSKKRDVDNIEEPQEAVEREEKK